jgi:hypothetical protein
MDLNIILEKPSLLSSVVDVSSFLTQFPATLYRFFQVHKKEDELVSFVVDLELSSGGTIADPWRARYTVLTTL